MSSRAKKKNRNAVPAESASSAAASPKKNRTAKIITLTLVGVLGVLLVLGIADVVIAYGTVYRWVHPERSYWSEAPIDVRLLSETFELGTPNGTVYGWVIPAQTPLSDEDENWEKPEKFEPKDFSDKTVVFAPNYDSNRELTDLGGADVFVDYCSAGYNVVTFDWTGSGHSVGDRNVFTVDKTEELRAVVAYAEEKTESSFLAVQGIGFGSYPAAAVTAETPSVDALILDSCYRDLNTVLFDNFGMWSAFDIAPVRGTTKLLFPLVSGVEIDSVSMIDRINQMKEKSIFFIQGVQDEVFGSDHIASFVAAANLEGRNKASSWMVPDVGHLRARSFDTEIYFNKVSAFLATASGSGEEGL